jgi:hypothetical protein
MSNAEAANVAVEPIRKTIVVRRTPEEAFAVFTERFGSWWPFTQFSIHQADTARCAFEAKPGGAIYEVSKDGERATWGSVRAWNPPQGFVLAWHPGSPPERATEVELSFEPVPEGTRVTLEHRDWVKLGDNAANARSNYDSGWVVVFEQRFAEACS